MRTRTQAIGVLLAVLVLGALLGAAATWWRYMKYDAVAVTTEPAPGPPRLPQRHESLPELLGMTAEQEARFDEIMQESRRQLDALRLEQRPKVDAVIAATNQKIRALLDDGQKLRLEEFLARQQKHRGRGPRGGRDFGPPPLPPPTPDGHK